MQNRFRVGSRRKNRARAFEFGAFFIGKRQISVVTNGDLPVLAGNGKRLNFLDRVFPGGRITRVPDGARAGQRAQNVFGQNVGDQAFRAKLMQLFAVGRNDAARFLPAMLQARKARAASKSRLRRVRKCRKCRILREIYRE
jgi:hypothetical protein